MRAHELPKAPLNPGIIYIYSLLGDWKYVFFCIWFGSIFPCSFAPAFCIVIVCFVSHSKESLMNIEYVVGAIVAVGLLAYLVFSILYPEKF